MVHHIPGSGDKYVAVVGNGSAWRQTAPFALIPDVESRFSVMFERGHLLVSVNGATVSDERDFGPMLTPSVPVTLGGYDLPGRSFSGRIVEFRFLDRAKFAD